MATARELLHEKGFKATTMDDVAKKLRMSKRTLYEIFPSKNDLIVQTLEYNVVQNQKKYMELIATSPNLIEGLVKVFRLHRDELSKINIDFFKDLDRLYPSLRENYKMKREKRIDEFRQMFQLGVEQEVFLPDLNYDVLARVLLLQMESIKRMEDFYPKEHSLLEIFDTITTSLLRSVTSPKGREILDKALEEL